MLKRTFLATVSAAALLAMAADAQLLLTGVGGVGGSTPPPVNTVAPVITGTATQGQTLTLTSQGTWTGSPTLTNQWMRGALPILGATGSTYVLTGADAGALIHCDVTGTNAGGSATASSNNLGPVVGFMQTAIMLSTNSTSGPSNTQNRLTPLAVSPSVSTWQTGTPNSKTPVAIDGTFSNLYARFPNALTGVQTWEVRLFKNGASTGLFCTITADGLLANDSVDTVDVVAGDDVYFLLTPTGTPTAQTNVQISLLFTATNTTDGPLFCTFTSGNSAGFGAFGSMQSQGGTEALNSSVMVAPGVISELRVKASAATGAGTSRTFTLRKNGADTGLTVTINNSDGTNTVAATPTSVSYAAGDTLSLSQTLSGAPAAASIQAGLNWKPTTPGQCVLMANWASALSTSATRYSTPRGTLSGGSGESTESNVYAVAPVDMTLKSLWASISTAAGASKSRTFTVRKDAADTALTVANAGASQVDNSVTTDVSVSAGDLISISTVPASTPAAVTWARTGLSLVVIPSANQVNFAITDISGDVFDGYITNGQPIVGGTYSGTPTDIQVRLIDSSGVQVTNAGWASATFASGVYSHTFTNIAVGGDYRQQVRNTSIGPITTATQRIYVGGVCYAFDRSQVEKFWTAGPDGLAPTAASLVTSQRSTDHKGQTLTSTRFSLGSQGIGDGAVAIANQWQRLTSNKPGKVVLAGYAGISMNNWANNLSIAGDSPPYVPLLTGYLHGVLQLAKFQPGVMVFFLSDVFSPTYGADLDTVIAYVRSLVPNMVIVFAPQLRITSTTGSNIQSSRQSHYDYALDVSKGVSLGGFALDVLLDGDVSPHQAAPSAAGNQRWGAYVGQWWASFLFDSSIERQGPRPVTAVWTDGTHNAFTVTFDKPIHSPDGLTAARTGGWINQAGGGFLPTGFTMAITGANTVVVTTTGSPFNATTYFDLFRGPPFGHDASDPPYDCGVAEASIETVYQKTIFGTTTFESSRGLIASPYMGVGLQVTP